MADPRRWTGFSRRAFLGSTLAASAAVLAACAPAAPPTPTASAPAKPAAPPAAAATAQPAEGPRPTTASEPAKPSPQAAAQEATKPAEPTKPSLAGAPAAKPAAGAQSVQLKMAGWYDKGTQKVAEKQIELFTQKFPAATVSIVVMPFQVEKNVIMMASGAAPDVFWVNNDQAAPWASRNAVKALDDYARRDNIDLNDLYDIGKVLYSYQNKIYAFPDSLAPLQILYNVKLFEAAGVAPPPIDYKDPSWTLDAMVEKAKALTKRSGSGPAEQFGLFIGTGLLSWLPLLWDFGGAIVDNDLNPTKVTFDSPGTRAVVQWVADLRLKHKVTATVAEAQGIPSTAQFTTGRLAMLLTGPWSWPGFMDPAVRSKVTWDIAPMPRGPAGQFTDMAGNGYGMASQTSNLDMAWELLKFNTLGDGQQINWGVETANGVPGRKSFAESPKFGSWFSERAKVALKQFPEYARYKPKHPNWAEMYTALDRGLDQVWTGAVTADEAVKSTHPQIDEAFGRKT